MEDIFSINNRMVQGYYVIFTKQGSNMCVGIDANNNCVLVPFEGDDSTTWIPQAISGTHLFYLIHQKTGLCAYFSEDDKIVLRNVYPTDDRCMVAAMNVKEGYVAINNWDDSLVWDAYRNSNKPYTAVNAYKWEKDNNDNQRWRFVPTTVLMGY